MKKPKLLNLILLLCTLFVALDCKAADQQCVILLHGLDRSPRSMSSLESFLKQHNYVVINEDYPSTKETIEEIANQNIPLMINECLKYHPDHINFVTHSMGGIVLQKYMEKHEIPFLGRIVMLGPPNHGSQLADIYHNNWLFKHFTGPAGQELTTDKNSLPNTIHLTHSYQIGVIAGTVSYVPFNNFIFHEANDGKVPVSSTKTTNMKDFIELPVNHTFMMSNLVVQQQILNFLTTGKFFH